MNKDKKVFLLSPIANVNALCVNLLPEENYHSSLTLVNEKSRFSSMKGWEMTIEQVRMIHKNAVDAGILGRENLMIAAYRRDGCTLRLLKKDEWILAEQHKRSLARKIAHKISNPIRNFLT